MLKMKLVTSLAISCPTCSSQYALVVCSIIMGFIFSKCLTFTNEGILTESLLLYIKTYCNVVVFINAYM